MGSAAKARAASRAAEAASVEARRHEHSLMPTHVAAAKPTSWLVLQKSVRGVVTAFVASARPLALAGVIVGLVWLALKIVDRFQLWMTAAGVLMIVMSVASAVQEVAKQQSTAAVEYLDEDVEQCKMITIPTTDKEIAVTMAPVEIKASSSVDVPLNVASPSLLAPPSLMTEAPVRSNSSTIIELGDNELTVVHHCGTVIEIQGARGLIMPHSLGDKTMPTKSKTMNRRVSRASPKASPFQLPLVIAFEISSVLAVLRHQIMVGQTVEFTFPGDEHSPESVCALDVTPVAPDAEIVKSRHALQTCKLAREASFARAMGDLTMISPRHEPITPLVDLIKYAEFLDDDDDDDADSPLEQFI